MRKTMFATILSAPMALGTVAVAEAAPEVCNKRSEIIDILGKKYGEKRRSFGLQNDRRVLELYASEHGSWTAIRSLPNGLACIVASGEAWTEMPPEPVGEPT